MLDNGNKDVKIIHVSVSDVESENIQLQADQKTRKQQTCWWICERWTGVFDQLSEVAENSPDAHNFIYMSNCKKLDKEYIIK